MGVPEDIPVEKKQNSSHLGKRMARFDDSVATTKKARHLPFIKRPNLLASRGLQVQGVRKVGVDSALEKSSDTLEKCSATEDETETVIESGPVEAADEDEPMMSAAELLAQQFGESGYGEEEEFY